MTVSDVNDAKGTRWRRRRVRLVLAEVVAAGILVLGCAEPTTSELTTQATAAFATTTDDAGSQSTTAPDRLSDGTSPDASIAARPDLDPAASGDDARSRGADAAPDQETTTDAESARAADPSPDLSQAPALSRAPIGFEELAAQVEAAAVPISIRIEDIEVADAPVIAVGVNADDLSFEVPPADQVGWYKFGVRPGENGSAVLAAHIAYNGVDGVFRHLEDVPVGAIVVVGFDDGTRQRFRVESVTEYVKEALPDSLFARHGREQLALITCGGNFNYQLDSYESNTVAIAVPI